MPPQLSIGQVVRNVRVFNLRNWQGATLTTHDLVESAAELFALLAERRIDYVLVGGLALLQYVEGRNIEDIDLIVALRGLSKLPEITLSSQELCFARGTFKGLQLDFLLTRHPLFEKVQREHVTVWPFAEANIPCATVEGLLLLKLWMLPTLYRQKNFARVSLYEADIATLMQEYRPEMNGLLTQVAPFLSETDLAALRDFVADIERRLARFGRGLGKDEG